MPRKLSTYLAVAALVGSSLVATAETAIADTVDCADFDQPVAQVIRPSNQSNLITTSEIEATGASRFGFTTDRGAVGKVSDGAGAGLAPVWRFYRSGDFAWATDGSGAEELIDNGYAKQFVAFYAATSDADCLSPVHQLVRNGIHRIAAADEVAGLVKDGWSQDQVEFYAIWGDPVQMPEEPTEPQPPAPTGDTKFSVAVIPDTQNESGAGSTRFANRVSWLVNNKSQLDLRYALQIGDLTNWGNVDPAQFTKLGSELKPLEAAVPWAGAIGNHDSAAVCVGGSACPGVSAAVGLRNTAAYNGTFPTTRFPRLGGTFEANKIDNSYQTFSAGGVDWLVLTLELWPRAAAVQWAQGVVASHPDHNVIVQTHAYLESNGSISQSQGGYGSTSPQFLYDNLIKQYPNIKLVLSGHVGDAAIRTDTGVNGNKIVSMLQTFHSVTNPVRIVEIDTSAGTMTSEIYAPGTNTEYPQFTTSTSGLKFVQ